MPIIVSPNMNLPVPVVGQEAGPQYAIDINNCLSLLDSHDHSSGSGVQINPSGININSSLPMNGNSLTLTGAVTFQPVLVDAANGSLYEKGVDLYYIDGSANVIRITQSGSLAGAAGTITGLPSGTASASYAAGVFTFQAATNTAANIDGGSFVFRNNTLGSFGLTLQPPNAMGADYSLTLPSIPGQTNVMTLDASGNMGSITYDAVGQNMTSVGANAIADSRTRTVASSVGIGGIAISGSSGLFNFNQASGEIAIFNQAVGITTSGRPVMVTVSSDCSGAGNPAFFSTSHILTIYLYRDATRVGVWSFDASAQGFIGIPASLSIIDNVSAGTYTYALHAQVDLNTAFVAYVRTTAYEL